MTRIKKHTLTGKAQYLDSPNISLEEVVKCKILTAKASKELKTYKSLGEEITEDEQENKE